MSNIKVRFVIEDLERKNTFASCVRTIQDIFDSPELLEDNIMNSINEELNFTEEITDYEIHKDLYTEIKDKNHEELFVNDVVQFHSKTNHKSLVRKLDSGLYVIDFMGEELSLIDEHFRIKKIGNIRENPELLIIKEN